MSIVLRAAVIAAAMLGGLAVPAHAAEAPAPLWVAVEDGPSSGSGSGAVVAADPATGVVYTAGAARKSNGSYDLVTIARDADGQKLWNRQYNGFGRGTDTARAIAVDSARGQLVVTAFSEGADGRDEVATVAYDRRGRQVWVARIAAPAGGSTSATDIAINPATGTIYLTGTTVEAGNADILTVAYAATGQLLWSQGFAGPGQATDSGAYVEVAAETGRVYVAGRSSSLGPDDPFEKYVLLAYSGTGEFEWSAEVTDLPDADNDVAGLALGPDDTAILLGRSVFPLDAGHRHQLFAYDDAGSLLWQAEESLRRGYANSDLTVDPDSGVAYLAVAWQRMKGPLLPRNRLVAAYSSTGERLWRDYFLATDRSQLDVAITVDPVRGVYVATDDTTQFGQNTVVSAYSALGDVRWRAVYAVSAYRSNSGPDLTVNPASGDVYVVGTSNGPNLLPGRIYTVAYPGA